MKHYITLIFILSFYNNSIGQSVVYKMNTESYTNVANTYNYTYWNDSWKTNTNGNRSFTNQTSSYALNIDYTNLSINNLVITDNTDTSVSAFKALNSAIFTSNYNGDIDYAILQNGSVAYDKSSNPVGTNAKDSQMAEYGVWCNRRFVSTNFTNSAPVDKYFTGVEFTNWHNRFKITFHVKPITTINNGQLRLSVDIPSEYVEYFTNGNLHAFGLDTDSGFIVKGGQSAESLNVVGNKLTVLTKSQNLVGNRSYNVSILFYVEKQNLSTSYTTKFNEESEITITANQTAPSIENITNDVNYNKDEGLHIIDIPRHVMGYGDCSTSDILQSIDFKLENSSSIEKRVRLCIRQIPQVNVTGFNSILCNNNGDPSGLPIQVSKNWHSTTPQLYSGGWIKEYTEFIIPANTALRFKYKRTGAKWGGVYAASSHQLSVVGASFPRAGWLQASVGGYGESITHSPDYEYGNTNVADIRPMLVTNRNYGGNASRCSWSGNIGGLDMWVYRDNNGKLQYQSEVKTKFTRYSPNLSETSVGAVSTDKKLKFDYTFYLNRSDDFLRVYYKINIEALQNTSFNRLDVFQLGSDRYNIYNTQDVKYGNDSGLIGGFSPTNNGSNDYTTPEIELTGNNPWVWAGDGLRHTGANGGTDIDTNNGMIIRDYKATINGVENNTPYFRERSSGTGYATSYNTNPTSYCIVTPPGTTSLTAGDKIELLVEFVVLPKMNGDYYGPNTNFKAALAAYGNSYELLYREALGNRITAESSMNTITTPYPLTVETSGDTGLVTVTGGKGYIPLVFSGLTNVNNPKLWKAHGNCWVLVNQSLHGKDFWQADYNTETKTYDLIYNVNHDIENDETPIIQYYLGNIPPELSFTTQSKVGNNSWNSDTNVSAVADSQTVIFDPQLAEYGTTTPAANATYSWTGPNGFTSTERVLNFNPVIAQDEGDYIVTYNNAFGCSATKAYSITLDGSLGVDTFEGKKVSFYPNPVANSFTISEVSTNTIIYNLAGQEVIVFNKKNTTFNVDKLSTGVYFVKIKLEDNREITKYFIKK